MQPRVLVVENDAVAPLEMVEQWLTEAGLAVEIIKPHAGDDMPTSIPARYSGLLVLGGRMGAHDDQEFTWLTAQRSMLKDAIASDFPFVGICLGAQMLATAVDGKSIRTPMPEAGVIQIAVGEDAKNDKLFGELVGDQLPAVAWHQDYIVDLPEDAVILASSDACPIHAFRIGENVYGMQFHPEANTSTVKQWATPKDEVLGKLAKSPETAVAEVDEMLDQLRATWKPIFAKWAQTVKSNRGL